MEAILFDSIAIEKSTRRKTPDGFLHVMGKITRVGVNLYDSDKTGLPFRSPKKVGVFRPADSVFHPETLRDVIGTPVTVNHPKEDVTPNNFNRHGVGMVTGEVVRRTVDDHLMVSMVVTDPSAIQAIENGQDELSIGSRAALMMHDGEFNGVKYDIQTSGPIKFNHIAVVPTGTGRAGREAKILDSVEGEENMGKKIQQGSQQEGQTEDQQSDQQESQTEESGEETPSQEASTQDAEPEGAGDSAGGFVPSTRQQSSGGMSTSEPAPKAKSPAMLDSDAVNALISERLRVNELCRPFLADGIDPSAMGARELLVLATNDMVDNPQEKSDDFLEGVLHAKSKLNAAVKANPDNQWGRAVVATQDSAGGNEFDPWSTGGKNPRSILGIINQ